jgi:hypothetical protein
MAMVLRYVLRAGLLILLLNFIAFAQGREKLYELKSDLTRVLLVHDPKCPLQLIEPSPVFGYENGAVVAEYTVQNISESNVISWEQHQINWLNNEERTERPEVLQDQWVFEPLTTYSSFVTSESFDRIEPDKKTAEKLGFSNWRNRILILMVVKVKLADGTTYDASKQLEELTTFLSKFLDKFDDEITKEEMESQQQRVRDFVATLFSKPTPEQPAIDK